ncbi:hypothetical protein HHK36_028160 [Tetracentron sinense]|uniref:Tobamovirus multiplication protein 2A n=1 Tax=Tetracentron sinense TaxID=13715 RepID=A0A834YKJ4_TETSI|nr:hypothetical protein HHK36_028160 [Tetracentron sinense]
MACKCCLNFLLKLLNFLLTLVGLAMVGYGIYLLIEWERASDLTGSISPLSENHESIQLGRPMMLAVSLSTSILDKLPKAWFIYLFIAVGVILFVISCFGCIGAVARNSCCLTCYSVFVILLILVELGCAAFIFFDHSWEDEIPTDKTGDFDMIYSFLKENWKIAKWVALGAVILEALLFLLALIVRAVNRPVDYDSDDEYIAIRQPLINRQGVPATGVPVVATLDQRPSRTDAWSTRMREKLRFPMITAAICEAHISNLSCNSLFSVAHNQYGLDTTEFTYNPSESNRNQQAAPQAAEERSCCTIM